LSSDGVAQGSQLWFSPNVANGVSLSQLTNYSAPPPTSVVFDPNSPSAQTSPGQIRFYVSDASNVWGTQNQGASFTSYNGNLPASFSRRSPSSSSPTTVSTRSWSAGAAKRPMRRARSRLPTVTPTATCQDGAYSAPASPTR
jgi:hypothetical protein